VIDPSLGISDSVPSNTAVEIANRVEITSSSESHILPTIPVNSSGGTISSSSDNNEEEILLGPRRDAHQHGGISPKQGKKKSNQHGKKFKTRVEIKGGPLETAWSFWFCKRNKSNFESGLQRLGTCHTVEEFWGFYVYLKRASELGKDCNLHLFRGATSPMWENFPNGGTWCLKLRKRCLLLNRMWEDLLIACIGELFEEPDVVGVALRVRAKEDCLYLWNKDVKLRYKLGEKLKQILQLPTNCPGMEYRFNKTAMENKTTDKQTMTTTSNQ